jgi:hypothetical protein
MNWSDVQRDSKAVAKAVDANGEITLIRRGEPDLTLMRADRRSDVREAGKTTTRLLRELLPTLDLPHAVSILTRIYSWLTFLPADAQAQFVKEYITTLNACADLDIWIPLARVIREWKATAAIHADPVLHAILTDSETVGDFGPVMPPEVTDAGEE